MTWSYAKMGLSMDHEDLLWKMNEDFVRYVESPCNDEKTIKCAIENFEPEKNTYQNKMSYLSMLIIFTLLCTIIIVHNNKTQPILLYILMSLLITILICVIQTNRSCI